MQGVQQVCKFNNHLEIHKVNLRSKIHLHLDLQEECQIKEEEVLEEGCQQVRLEEEVDQDLQHCHKTDLQLHHSQVHQWHPKILKKKKFQRIDK